MSTSDDKNGASDQSHDITRTSSNAPQPWEHALTQTTYGATTPNQHHSQQSAGDQLRSARLAKGMSIEEVSRQLRLSVQQIDAIEQDAYEKLPGRTFLRGFVRNYANLLQLDPTALLITLPESAHPVSSPENKPLRVKQISFSSERKKPRSYSLPVVVIITILMVSAYFIIGKQNLQHSQNEEPTTSQQQEKSATGNMTKELQLPVPLPASAKNPIEPVSRQQFAPIKTDSASVEIPLNLKPALAAAESKPVAQAGETIPPPDDPTIGHLQFKLSADSWIRVVDGAGVNLVEQIKKAGSEHTVSGKKPFAIILGNAAGVNLTYNDKEIDISSYKNQGGTARFTLE